MSNVGAVLFSLVCGLLYLASAARFQAHARNLSSITLYADDDNNSGPWDGSITHPYVTIGQALNAASAGMTIFVLPGLYHEYDLHMPPGVNLQGSGMIDTTVDGGSPNNIAILYANSDCRIAGFTFTHGAILPGGGTATGAIQLGHASAVIEDNYFVDNDTAVRGNSDGIIRRNIFQRNRNGVFTTYVSDRASPTISGNVFSDNSFAIFLGANSTPTIQYNTIAYNGRGISHGNGQGVATVVNSNIVVFNDYGMSNTISGEFKYNDVWGNTNNEGYVPGIGDIAADPQFVDSGARNFHLLPQSPCIDSGDPSLTFQTGETDIDGDVRVFNGRLDIGYDEFTLVSAVPSVDWALYE